MLPPAVLWIDGGGMTGLAKLEQRQHFLASEFAFRPACDQIWWMCSYYRGELWIGWERWQVFADTHKKTPQPEAPEINGVAKYAALVWGCRILTPAQQHTPDKQDQKRLKAIGWWVPGMNDAQSAACHLLAWLMRENELPPRERQIIMEAAA